MENLESSYIPLDIAASVNEWNDGVQGGESCGIDAMKDVFAWMRGSINGWYGWANDGKMEHIDNQIITPKGFVKMGDLGVGDTVFDENGLPCKIIRVTETQYGKKCFRVIFNDGETVICGEEHLWLTYNNAELRSYNSHRKRTITRTNYNQAHKRHLPKVRTTLEISETMAARNGRTGNNHAIQLSKPLQFDEKILLLNPYVLGAWLGDGSSSGPSITNHELDADILRNIEFAGYQVKKHKTTKGKTANFQIGSRGEVMRILRHYNLVKNKHIPSDYSLGSFTQRLHLLQGLMDTDGYINKSGMAEFCACNRPEFAAQVYSLICSLGIRAGITKSDAKLYGRKTSDRYRITFKTTLPIFRLARKYGRIPKKVDKAQEFRFIVKCEPIESVPCRCIQIDSPNKLYLTGRSFIPTHNSEFRDYLKVLKAKRDGWKFCIFRPEDMNSIISEGKAKIKANRLYKNLAWNLTGQTWNEAFAKKYYLTRMTLDEEQDALTFITDHIFVIYPKDRHYKNIQDEFRFMHEKYGIDAFEIDTFSGVLLPAHKGERDDEKMVRCFFDFKQLALETNTVIDFVAHAKAQNDVKEKDGRFKVVNQFMVLGGSAWDAKMDGQYSIYRPERHLSPKDPKVHFWNLKQKESQIVGVERGVCEGIEFAYTKKQYFFDGVNPLTGEVKLKPGEKKGPIDFSQSKPRDPDELPL